MKTSLIAVAAAITVTTAVAWFTPADWFEPTTSPEFTIINTSSKASPATVFSMGFKKPV